MRTYQFVVERVRVHRCADHSGRLNAGNVQPARFVTSRVSLLIRRSIVAISVFAKFATSTMERRVGLDVCRKSSDYLTAEVCRCRCHLATHRLVGLIRKLTGVPDCDDPHGVIDDAVEEAIRLDG